MSCSFKYSSWNRNFLKSSKNMHLYSSHKLFRKCQEFQKFTKLYVPGFQNFFNFSCKRHLNFLEIKNSKYKMLTRKPFLTDMSMFVLKSRVISKRIIKSVLKWKQNRQKKKVGCDANKEKLSFVHIWTTIKIIEIEMPTAWIFGMPI